MRRRSEANEAMNSNRGRYSSDREAILRAEGAVGGAISTLFGSKGAVYGVVKYSTYAPCDDDR